MSHAWYSSYYDKSSSPSAAFGAEEPPADQGSPWEPTWQASTSTRQRCIWTECTSRATTLLQTSRAGTRPSFRETSQGVSRHGCGGRTFSSPENYRRHIREKSKFPGAVCGRTASCLSLGKATETPISRAGNARYRTDIKCKWNGLLEIASRAISPGTAIPMHRPMSHFVVINRIVQVKICIF